LKWFVPGLSGLRVEIHVLAMGGVT
jgi:hypothetical protein